jgi:probable phosphoglycerate mutase
MALGGGLRSVGVAIDRVFSGPLRRTREFAEVVIKELGQPKGNYLIDERLTELDYGLWGGLTKDEIVARYGAACLENWEALGEYPSGVGFSPSREQVTEELKGLLSELSTLGGVSLVVTSNGRLRVLGALVTGDKTRSWKVGTGRFCVLEAEGDGWRVLGWDLGVAKSSSTGGQIEGLEKIFQKD